MKVKLIKDYPGIGRKKGDTIGCNALEFPALIEQGYIADPKKKAKADGENG